MPSSRSTIRMSFPSKLFTISFILISSIVGVFDCRGQRLPVAAFAGCELRPPAPDHIAILFVQFNHPALAAGLLTGNQRRTAAAEIVQDDLAPLGRVPDEIHQHFHRLHGRVYIIALGLVKAQQIALTAVGIPVVRCSRFPAINAGFTLQVIVKASEVERLFDPVERFVDFQIIVASRQPEIHRFTVPVEDVEAPNSI